MPDNLDTSSRWNRVEELFHAALQQPAEDRGGFLKRECGSDSGLRRDVESLLTASDCDDLLDRPAMSHMGLATASESRQAAWTPGSTFGHYRILERLGAGGMGEVFRARDTQLDRDVALKTLTPDLSHDRLYLERLRREARSLASVNHPNVATLHEIAEAEGRFALVMELIEGETLAKRLSRSRLRIAEIIAVATQIAEALEAAHRRGVVHRDLKPGNIMIAHGGLIKVLDFGLAKRGRQPPSKGVSEYAGEALTSRGSVLGTAGYMSPEQADGRDADERSDIFSFGAILYELAAGCPAFGGETAAQRLSSILRDEPPTLENQAPDIPKRLRRLIWRCLQKNSGERYQNITDVKFALGEIKEDLGHDEAPRAVPAITRRRVILGAALATGGAALSYVGLRFRRDGSATAGEVELDVQPPANSMGFALDVAVAVSPDGSQLGLRAVAPDGNEALWIRPINSSMARPLPGSGGAMGFFWSPESNHIAFFSEKLHSIDIHGGPPLILGDLRGRITSSGAWGPGGNILLASLTEDGGLSRFSLQTSTAEPINRLNSKLPGHYFEPQFLPDGRHFLFGYRPLDHSDLGIYLASLDDTAPRRLISGASHGYYTRPAGSTRAYIVFERNLFLMAQEYDEQHEHVTGEARAITSKPLAAWRAFSCSHNGVIAYHAGNPNRTLGWVNREGKRIANLPFQGDYRQITLSPDESMLAVARMDETSTDLSNIWLLDLSRGTSSRLTSYRANDWYPIWSPDGKRVAFTSSKDGPFNLYVHRMTGIDTDQSVLSSPALKFVSSWSRDGKLLAYSAEDAKTHFDIWILPLSGAAPFPFLRTEYDEMQPEFSPNGQWIAYSSNESGRFEVYVRSFHGGPATGAGTRISIDGGSHPKWRPDGKELFFLAPDRKLMSAEIHLSPDMTPGPPKPLFQTRIYMANFLSGYAVAQNGQRFLINAPTEEEERSPVTVISNWNPDTRR